MKTDITSKLLAEIHRSPDPRNTLKDKLFEIQDTAQDSTKNLINPTLLCSPMNSGKTYSFMSAIERHFSTHNGNCVYIYSPTNDVSETSRNNVIEMFESNESLTENVVFIDLSVLNTTVYQAIDAAKYAKDHNKKIIILCTKKLENKKRTTKKLFELTKGKGTLVLLDEAHYGSTSCQENLSQDKGYFGSFEASLYENTVMPHYRNGNVIIGFTATPTKEHKGVLKCKGVEWNFIEPDTNIALPLSCSKFLNDIHHVSDEKAAEKYSQKLKKSPASSLLIKCPARKSSYNGTDDFEPEEPIFHHTMNVANMLKDEHPNVQIAIWTERCKYIGTSTQWSNIYRTMEDFGILRTQEKINVFRQEIHALKANKRVTFDDIAKRLDNPKDSLKVLCVINMGNFGVNIHSIGSLLITTDCKLDKEVYLNITQLLGRPTRISDGKLLTSGVLELDSEESVVNYLAERSFDLFLSHKNSYDFHKNVVVPECLGIHFVKKTEKLIEAVIEFWKDNKKMQKIIPVSAKLHAKVKEYAKEHGLTMEEAADAMFL